MLLHFCCVAWRGTGGTGLGNPSTYSPSATGRNNTKSQCGTSPDSTYDQRGNSSSSSNIHHPPLCRSGIRRTRRTTHRGAGQSLRNPRSRHGRGSNSQSTPLGPPLDSNFAILPVPGKCQLNLFPPHPDTVPTVTDPGFGVRPCDASRKPFHRLVVSTRCRRAYSFPMPWQCPAAW